MMSWLIGLFRPKEPIIPEPCICEICYELEAKKRVCCNGSFCDHCYTKYKACPRCKNATRIEKMTGATYVLPMFNENEECRICLDAGVKRRCCGQYYCDDCYFRLAKCRSCDQLVDKNAFGVKSWGRAYIVTILLGWALTLLVGLILFTIIGIITLNAIQTPVGIQGFVCAGFFRTCDIAACIEVSHNVSLGTSALDSSFLWRECDLRSAYKLRAPACIFDSALYSSTNQILGYDVCKSSFHNDIIVFEDTFEDWANGTLASNTMVSGRWAEVYNGETGSYCGHGTEGGADALVFFGEVSRYAETLDVDLTLGGSIEADLFLAPLYFEQSHPQCRTAFTGVVSLQSSIDEGATWTTLKEFDPVKYRQKNFFRISADIPASSTVVLMRFRFIQLHFDSGGDNWALDNVRVLRHLPSTWLTNAAAQESRATSQREIQFASCCFDTDNCANRLTASEAVGCSTVPGFTTQRVHIREAEVWILLALALSVIKFIYVSIQDFLIQGKLPFQDEVEEILLLNFIREKIPARYRLKKESNDFVSDVHRAARLNAAHRHRLRDEDGKGTVMVKTKEEQEKINAERLAIKVKALQKKIRKMKKRGVIVHEVMSLQ